MWGGGAIICVRTKQLRLPEKYNLLLICQGVSFVQIFRVNIVAEVHLQWCYFYVNFQREHSGRSVVAVLKCATTTGVAFVVVLSIGTL